MFEEISLLGKVNIERVLFSFEGEPIVFICKNRLGTRYICVNTGYGFEPSWLIARSSKKVIIKMLKDEISIFKAISESIDSIFVVHQVADKLEYQRLPFDRIDRSELPDENETLQNSNVSEYIQQLESEELLKDYCRLKKSCQIKKIIAAPVMQKTGDGEYSSIKKFKRKSEPVEYIEG